MTTITYHVEPTPDGPVAIWAECDRLPGFSALGIDLDEVRDDVHTALAESGLVEFDDVREQLAENGVWFILAPSSGQTPIVQHKAALQPPASEPTLSAPEWELCAI